VLQIAAFRPLRYDPERISFISRVVAPPYDLVGPAMAEDLHARDPHNVVRLILGKAGPQGHGDLAYATAAETLRDWRNQSVLVREDEPSVYVIQQSFELDGENIIRHGLICAMLLEEFASGRVMPHEDTMDGPKADRLRLMQACKASLSQIFGIFSDDEGAADAIIRSLTAQMPLYEFADTAGVAYRVWRVGDCPRVRKLGALLKQERLLIADGHHRYETALRYRELHRSCGGPPGSAPEDFLPVFCVSAKDAGLRILPTHRLVQAEGEFRPEELLARLKQDFEVEELQAPSTEALRAHLRAVAGPGGATCCYMATARLLVLRPLTDDPLAGRLPDRPEPWRRLPVAQLHHLILEPHFGIPGDIRDAHPRLSFTQDVDSLFWEVESGRAHAALLLPPLPSTVVEEIAQAGVRMPPKSTFFYPKIASGLLFYPFENDQNSPILLG
jgi:uncharacterized protein (DUF1015 family)